VLMRYAAPGTLILDLHAMSPRAHVTAGVDGALLGSECNLVGHRQQIKCRLSAESR
jgi:hypothetical protein